MRGGLVRTVVRTLRHRPALLCFPALNVATLGLLVAAWISPLQVIWERARLNQSPTVVQSAVILLLLFVLSCVGTYFTAALLHSVHSLLAGGRPTIRASLGAAVDRLPVLVGWTLVGSSVGPVLRVLESTAGLSWLFDLAGLSWSLLTFFVLPVIVVEGGGLLVSLRRSLTLGRRQLGSWVAGGLRLFLMTGFVVLAGVAALILAVETDSATVMLSVAGIVVVLWLLAGTVYATSAGIYRMTLYYRAVHDGPPPGAALAGASAVGAEKAKYPSRP